MHQETIETKKIIDYYNEGYSMKEVADLLKISYYKVRYCLQKEGISRRSLSDAIYRKNNSKGDPFSVQKINSIDKGFYFGLGIGLFWGEGCKKNMKSIRLGNSDPYLIKSFIVFLKKIYKIDEEKLKFSLQVFSDMNIKKTKEFWARELNIKERSLGKVTVTPSRSIGTYKEKSKYGVLTVYFNNIKLRKIVEKDIEKVKNATIAQLAEHNNGNVEVAGSIPARGSNFKIN